MKISNDKNSHSFGRGRVESLETISSRPRPKVFLRFSKIQVSEKWPDRPLAAAPDHINGAVLHAWNEIVDSAPLDVLTNSDRISLEIAANLLAQFRNDPIEFTAAKLVRLEALLGKFGMTPADRAKVGGKKEAPKGNPFADL